MDPGNHSELMGGGARAQWPREEVSAGFGGRERKLQPGATRLSGEELDP